MILADAQAILDVKERIPSSLLLETLDTDGVVGQMSRA
jgi:hypothetical protein